MRSRFFWSTTAVVVFVVVLVGSGLVLLLQNLAEAATRQEMTRQAQVIELIVKQEFQTARAEGFTIDRIDELFEEDQPLSARPAQTRRNFTVFLRSLLDVARDIAGGSRVELALLDAEGNVRSFQGVADDELTSLLGVDAVALSAGQPQFLAQAASAQQGSEVLALVHPFTPAPGSPISSTVLLVIARETPVIDWAPLIRPLLLTLAAATALAAFLARWLSRRLTRRLDHLSDAARRIADGDAAARVPEMSEDELAELSRSFNDMADRLQEGRMREQEFLMSVGHDLRTPLTTISGYAEAIEEGGVPEAELSRVGGVLAAETGRLRRLVDDLMLLARLEAREFTLSPEPVDVGAHLSEVAAGFRPRAEAAHVRLETDIGTTGIVETDPDRVAQIAGNLLENGLRYTPEAGVVRLAVGRANGQITLVVSDSGPGIEPGDLPHAFEKFYVARKYRRVRPEGSGLGLSIVKQLVDALSGTVRLESVPGEGTKVTVSLPAERP